MAPATRGARPQRAEFAMFFAGITWAWFGAVFLFMLAVNALRCDESCGGLGWRRSGEAWQWDVVLALGGVALFAGMAFLVAIRRRRPARAAVAYAVGLGAALAGITVLAPGWVAELSGTATVVGFLAIGLFAPVAALMLIAERPGQP